MTGIEDVRDISRIAYGFMASKALFAALDIELFGRLADGPKPLGTLAAETGVAAHRLEPLLAACTGLGLLERAGEGWANAPASQRYLVPTAPAFFGDYYRFQIDRQVYPGLEALEDALAGRKVAGLYDSVAADPAFAAEFTRGQHAGSLGPAHVLAKSVDLSGARTLLDVGGGSGAFSITLCRRFPELHATILDFPSVVDVAREYVDAAGLTDRIDFLAAGAEEVGWPSGVDALLMSYLLSAVGRAEAPPLVARAFEALAPGGRLLVHDFVVDDDRAGPDLAALWSLVMVVGNPDAGLITPTGLSRMLADAGFTAIEAQPLIADITSLVVARKP